MNDIEKYLTAILLASGIWFSAVASASLESEEQYLENMYNAEAYECGFLGEKLLAGSSAYEVVRKILGARSFAVEMGLIYSKEKNSNGVDEYFLSMHSPPLYFCSGLIVRGTRQAPGEGRNAWDPYPAGRTADTSFSYLRSDIRMTRLAWSYTNGFIIDPTVNLNFNCFYPLDAASDERMDKGCGAHTSKPEFDPDCSSRMEMDDSVPAPERCRYNLRTVFAFAQFAEGVKAAAKASRTSDLPNDLKVETWKDGCDQRLEIRAFFYINDEGKPFAERDRKKYEEVCKKHVSLVYMIFPENKDGLIKFRVVD